MLDSVVKVTLNSDEINDADFEKMKKYRFSDDEIWDTTMFSPLFALSNQMVNFTSMRPNNEFYLLERVPK